jgi:hypothetical protein
MRLEDVDFAQQANTFWAVFLGAFLATIGGIAATQAEAYIGRRDRERDGARLFGEILTTLEALMRVAGQTRNIGDPYGPITLRMLRAARRELEVYDRNRELLAEIRDRDLRANLHSFMVRLTMPIDGVLEGSAEIAALRAALRVPGVTPEDRAEGEETIALMNTRRDQGFDVILESREEIPDLMKMLARISKQPFKPYDTD